MLSSPVLYAAAYLASARSSNASAGALDGAGLPSCGALRHGCGADATARPLASRSGSPESPLTAAADCCLLAASAELLPSPPSERAPPSGGAAAPPTVRRVRPGAPFGAAGAWAPAAAGRLRRRRVLASACCLSHFDFWREPYLQRYARRRWGDSGRSASGPPGACRGRKGSARGVLPALPAPPGFVTC